MGFVGVPVIDMQNADGLAQKLVEACSENGCFRVVNHGVPPVLMAEMRAVSAAIFNLPEDVKSNVSKPGATKAYRAYTSIFESTGIYDFTESGAIDTFSDQLGLSPHQREIIGKYTKTLQNLANNIGRQLMEGLGLAGELYDEWACTLRLNKYNYNNETIGATGAVWHTDAGFITILQDDDNVNGLEMMDKVTGKPFPDDPIIGTSSLSVHCGDIAQVWSNGRFHNVKHHVICHQPNVRLSMGVFVLGPKVGKVEAPSKLIDSEHPQRYVPFEYAEYRDARLLAKDACGALELYTIKND